MKYLFSAFSASFAVVLLFSGCSSASQETSTSPTPTKEVPTEQAELTTEEQNEIYDSALMAVQEAYFDCFPAVAAGVTIIEFIRDSPPVAEGASIRMFTPISVNGLDGVVTVGTGDKILQFDVTQDSIGSVTSISPLDEGTSSALEASQCVQHGY
jgi:hypothetical protein